MSIRRISEIFIGNGAALDAGSTAVASLASQIAVVGTDMTALTAGNTISIANRASIYIVNKLANGDFKYSFKINGTSVTGYKAEHYAPSRRNVWSIGYQRGYRTNPETSMTAYTAASGSITVANSTVYSASIIFKNDKQFYSQRPERLSITFTSAAAATQLTIATQIAGAINSSAFGSTVSGVKEIVAIVVGDGTGVYGVTGAANFGVEITGLTINQFQNTSYQEELVYFSVHVDDSTGFGSGTTVTELQKMKAGTGTYNQVYNLENFNFGFEGVLNRRLWPIPVLAYLSSATYTTSGDVVGAATLPVGALTAAGASTNTVGQDLVAVTTATTGLRGGELIVLNTTAYEVKYVRSATTFVLTAPLTQVVAASTLKVKYLYNIININVTDVTILSGAGVGQFSPKTLYIATPSIDAAAADPFDRTLDSADTSAECLGLLAILSPWMTSTPLAPLAPTLV